MVSSEKTNGLAAPGRESVMRTAFTPVSGTLARSVMAPSASVVTDAWCRVASLAAFWNRRSSLVLGGQLEPGGLQGPAAHQGKVGMEVVRLGGGGAGQQPQHHHRARDRERP